MEQSENKVNRIDQVPLGDLVGNYGFYQAYLTILLFMRYILFGFISNSGTMLAPDVTFYCDLPMEEIVALMPNLTELGGNEKAREIDEEFKGICQLNSDLYQRPVELKWINNSKYRICDQFRYKIDPAQGKTMTNEFDLVCERDNLRFVYQSLISFSIVAAYVFWGTFSDRYGRFAAQRLCLLVSLLAGCISIIAADFWTFLVARSICSFGDLGLVVSLTTSVVELVGSNYRGSSVAFVNFGSAVGVSLIPFLVSYFKNFRSVIVFSVVCHAVTIPFLMVTNESPRWLLTNRKFKRAEHELKRINQLNFRFVSICNFSWISEGQSKGIDESFNIKFKQLIELQESQNLCDPLNDPASSQSPSPIDIHKGGVKPEKSVEPIYSLENQFKSMSSIVSSRANESSYSSSASLDTIYFEEISIDRKISEDISSIGDIKIQVESKELVNDEPQPTGPEQAFRRRRDVNQRSDCINLVTTPLSFMGRVNQLFRDRKLMAVVFTIVWTTFSSELLYASFILINLEVGEDTHLNYLLGGCMEALAAVLASFLLSWAPRRESLTTFWLLISMSCFGLSIAHVDSHWAVWLLALSKLLQSALSSIANVVAYEAFPTFLRQSGSGLVFTLGMLGSVFAPLIFAELDDQDGMDLVLFTFSLLAFTAAILIPIFLKETKDCELK